MAVGDGAQALRALADDPPPDIVLADVVMPGPDGYELCERVKRDARLRDIPVVLLVGAFEPFNEAEARRVGADTVLTKPSIDTQSGRQWSAHSSAAIRRRTSRRTPPPARRTPPRRRRPRALTPRVSTPARAPPAAFDESDEPGARRGASLLRRPRRPRRADRGAAGRSFRRAPEPPRVRRNTRGRARLRRAARRRPPRRALPETNAARRTAPPPSSPRGGGDGRLRLRRRGGGRDGVRLRRSRARERV